MEKGSSSGSLSSSEALQAVIGLASPKDRLAAVILDVLLLLPLVRLIQAPVKREITEIFLLGGELPWFYQYFTFGSFIVLFIFYHSLMIYWRGQTIGKMFFKIQVISYNGYLSFSQCLLRSVLIIIECFLLGYPFMALFSHPLRRPIHDRVTDSLVIGLSHSTGYPGFKEKWKSRFVGNVLLIFILIFGLNYKMGKNNDLVALDDKKHCQFMKQQKGSDTEKFLELYLSHQISRPCLLEVARASLWKGEKPDLAKFSLAFALGNNGQQSNQYLRDICEGQSEQSLCFFSKWLLELDQVNDESLDKLHTLLDKDDLNDSLRVIIAGFFRSGKQFKRTLRVLEPVQSNETLQPLVAGLLFHSLLGQKKWSEAFWVYRSQASIDSGDILAFLKMERENKKFGRDEKLAMFDFFFPQLRDYKQTNRWPSSSNIPDKRLVEAYTSLVDFP